MSTNVLATRRSVNVLVGYVFGAVYLLVGLLGFEVNPLHNIVHLAVGAALVLAARQGVAASRAVNTAVGGVYLLVGVLGLFILGSSANILALNSADNVLHVASAAVLLAVGLATDRR